MKKTLLVLMVSAGTALAAISTAEAAWKYGSLAYDKATGKYGYSYGYSKVWQSQNRALKECGWGGCHVYMTFANTCGALATDDAKGIWGWGTNDNSYTAKQRALYECGIRGGNCKLRVWACSNP